MPPPTREPGPGEPGHIHVSHRGRRAIPPDIAEETNRWAFVAEKVLHGNPSGVDNSVAVFGGALAYVRPGFGKRSGMDQIQGFKSLRFLLVDSKVPRDTKALVAGVARKKAEEPETVQKLLDSIQAISNEARRALADPDVPREVLLSGLSVCFLDEVPRYAHCLMCLQALIDENHAHLVSLGVSHPALEAIRVKTSASPYSLSTKLTGAGGGGCAVTLVPDGLSTMLFDCDCVISTRSCLAEFHDSSLKSLIAALEADGFQPYVTAVGGSGLGILSPYDDIIVDDDGAEATPLSPPMTPDPYREGGALLRSIRARFESVDVEELSKWASGRGKWLYV